MTSSKSSSLSKSQDSKSSIRNKSEKYIDPKNYLYAGLILVGGILIVLYIFEWYNVKREEKLMNSYLVTSNTVEETNLESLSQSIQEAPSSYFIYLSYTNSEEVYNLEKTLKRVIDKYKLNDIFYYVNLSNLKENDKDYLNYVKQTLNLPTLEKIPAIVYINEGNISESNILTGKGKNILQASELENLLEKNEFDIVK